MFNVSGRGWVAAGDLNVGDEVYLIDGSAAYVTGAELEQFEEPVTVYNLEVDDFHTYFVGDKAILVHNDYKKGEPLADDDNVVRGGESGPGALKDNQAKELPGRGSMSANGGAESVDELARHGNTGDGFPQGKFGSTTAGDIRGLGDGWDVIHDPTDKNPYHVAIIPPGGAPLTDSLAEALSSLFQANLQPNIYRHK